MSFRLDSPTGTEVARVTVANTGGWDNYTNVTATVTQPDDNTHDLYLVFTGTGTGALFDLDSYLHRHGCQFRHDPPPGGEPVAQGKPVPVSSTEAGANVAANVSRQLGDRWSGLYADPQWITVDLSQSYAVNRVRLNWETAFGRAYQVQISADNATGPTCSRPPPATAGSMT